MNEQIIALKVAAPYIRRYRDQIFVIKIGGSVLADAETIESVAEQCTLLADIGIRPVIVHGGGKQATALSEKMGLTPKIVAGRRVTDDATLELVKMVFAGQVNVDLVSALRAAGGLPVGLSGIDGELITADRRPPVMMKDDDGVEAEVDFQNVGDIREVNVELILGLLEKGFLPVVCSLGADDKGNPLNINADTMAEAIAVGLNAKKLIFLTDRAGVLRDADDSSTLIPFADSSDLKELLETDILSGGMRPKVEACIRASTSGVKRTHIINGTVPKSLLIEVMTGEGCGTMIVGEREKQIYQEQEHAKP